MLAGELLPLFGHLAAMSLMSVGGALAVVPELRRVFVTNSNLLTDGQFDASIAIGTASPGPSVLFVALMGYQAAGALGAAVALIAILVPSTALAFAAARWGHKRRDWRAIRAFKCAMAPIVIGLLFATGWVISTRSPAIGGFVAAAAAALLTWRTRVHVLAMVAAGAAAGALGWL
jgi:chromate transporter